MGQVTNDHCNLIVLIGNYSGNFAEVHFTTHKETGQRVAVKRIKEIAVSKMEGSQRETLRKLAATAMSSKLIHRNAGFFTKSKIMPET